MLPEISEDIKNANGVFINTVDVHILEDLYQETNSLDWLDLMQTQILLPPEVRIPNIEELLKLTPDEVRKLEVLTINTRMFLIKQDERVIAAELSIGGLQGLTRFLSSGKLEMIKQQFFCKFTFHLFYITRSYLNKQHQ